MFCCAQDVSKELEVQTVPSACDESVIPLPKASARRLAPDAAEVEELKAQEEEQRTNEDGKEVKETQRNEGCKLQSLQTGETDIVDEYQIRVEQGRKLGLRFHTETVRVEAVLPGGSIQQYLENRTTDQHSLHKGDLLIAVNSETCRENLLSAMQRLGSPGMKGEIVLTFRRGPSRGSEMIAPARMS
eukprot:TRINITY_DN1470_c0_g1_i2.p1 TRINITY_DN1470_c0_g1~~TRINITY_DN1470_c0_g1_i2.p1  ORF type:complete len:202 (+),score=28.83 TRINITY_DN1470_c0_g1_i2:46-606(+)